MPALSACDMLGISKTIRQGESITDTFYRDWFAAWMRGMEKCTVTERAYVFRECGKNCARPEILPMYQQLLKREGNAEAFFIAVNRDVEGVTVRTVKPGRIYDFCYASCLCPIYEECGVNNGLLCECSLESLRYVMRELFPAAPPQVELLTSVLRGDSECRFRFSFPE